MTNNNDKGSIFLRNIERGKQEGLITFTDDNARITYHCSREYSTSFKNPEETVRASYFVELVLDYQYPQKQIDIEVTVPRRTPEDRADIVIYEDDDLLVLCKPAGLVVHPSPGHTAHTLVNALLARCPDLASFGDTMRPGIVHRLDRDTSGLMIVAKNSRAQQYLMNQFKVRSVTKGYLALVKGKLTPGEGIIDAPLGRDPSNRKRMAVVTAGRQARTRFKVKEYLDGYTLLDITTKTGRTHQIRVHLSAIGYPVVGDAEYGVRSPYLKRQFLHAYRLGFRLIDGQYREFSCELPPDLKGFLASLSRTGH